MDVPWSTQVESEQLCHVLPNVESGGFEILGSIPAEGMGLPDELELPGGGERLQPSNQQFPAGPEELLPGSPLPQLNSSTSNTLP